MKITFIRHSQTLVEPSKSIVLWGLSDDGVAKAQALSRDEAIKGLDVIYSSLQTKAIETMVYLAKPNAIPMRTHADLTEITSFTKQFFTGDEYTSQVEQYYTGKLDRIADGETIDEALSRFITAIELIIDTESHAATIGIVSHGSILSFFTARFSGLEAYTVHQQIQQPDMAEFDWDAKVFTRLWVNQKQ